jgi:hypothetical protein
MIRLSRGVPPMLCSWPLRRIVFGTKATPFAYRFTDAKELGDIKVMSQDGLKGCSL